MSEWTGRGGSPWGEHVYKKKASSASKSAISTSLDLGEKLASKLLAAASTSSSESFSTRSSLKRKRGLKRSASSFFDTISVDENSQQSQSEEPRPKVVFIDPLLKFDPDISIDSFDAAAMASAKSTSPESAATASSGDAGPFVPSDEDESSCWPQSRFARSHTTGSSQTKLQPVNFLSALKNVTNTRRIDEGWLTRCSEQTVRNCSGGDPAEKKDVPRKVQMRDDDGERGAQEHNIVLLRADKTNCLSATASDALVDADLAEEEEDVPVVKRKTVKSRSVKSAANPQTKPPVAKKAKQQSEAGPSAVNVYALGFEEPEVDIGMRDTSLSKTSAMLSQTKEDLMRKRMGKDNFVKINLKKKTFVRGRKTMTGGKYRRMEYKKKMAAKEGKQEKVVTCFKCNQEGHMSRDCAGSTDKLMPKMAVGGGVDGEGKEELADFPTLEEASAMARGSGEGSSASSTVALLREVLQQQDSSSSSNVVDEKDIFDEKDDDLLLKACAQWNPSDTSAPADAVRKVQPYFDEHMTDDQCRAEMTKTLRKFGYSDFRPGQTDAILNILRGQSTLVLLATGSGKSLIYQIPAYLYGERENCITIVVSPLVSLMEDQVDGLPASLRAACLHSNQTDAQREKVAEQVKEGKLHFLLVSPETLASGGGVFASLLKDLPPIAFVCIDEAHCISQWSHNFRPAYLRLCKIIREKLGVQTILGLTATAPESTIKDIALHLAVCPDSGIVRGPLLPKNLTLSVSKDQDRDVALLKLLKGKRLATCDSIIIYCTRREECVRISNLIRTMLQDDNRGDSKQEARSMNYIAECYHAGLTAHKRKSVQKNFMSGKLRIVVATVAFGMGIDKADIRAVIHYNMPKTFESYIQEIGRAGRDGEEAHCHLFLNRDGQDMNELKRHIYANSVDEVTIRKLLNVVFDQSKEADNLPGSRYKEVAATISEVVEELDLPEENISTLLCYLESDEKKWVKLLNPAYGQCKIRCYGGPRQFKALAHRSPPLAAAIAYARKKGVDFTSSSQIEFPVVELAANMGWDSGVVKRELKNLQWSFANGNYKKSGVLVEFSNLAFHFEALKGLSGEEKDRLKEFLIERTKGQERLEVYGLQRVFRSFSSVAHNSYAECCDEVDIDLSDKLKQFILDYFREEERTLGESWPETKKTKNLEAMQQQLQSDVRMFVLTHSDHKWTGRAVARVFQGIGSPNFPAKQWGRVRRFWRSYLEVDFNDLCSIAKETILTLRQGYN